MFSNGEPEVVLLVPKDGPLVHAYSHQRLREYVYFNRTIYLKCYWFRIFLLNEIYNSLIVVNKWLAL